MVKALAWRSVRARKLRALLNGLGIVLGVALAFSVVSLSKTIVTTFDDLFGSVYGETDLILSGSDYVGTLDEELLTKVKRIEGVEVATASVSSVATLVTKRSGSARQDEQVNIAGVDPADPDLSGSKYVAGRAVRSGYEFTVDDGFAERNGLKVGRTVALATQTGVKRFKLVGLFRLGQGLDFGGQGFASIPIDVARTAFDMPKGFAEINVAIKPGADLKAIRAKLESLVDKGIEVRTPSDISDDINKQLQGFNIILYFFSAMSLFVGGFLILNSFNMTIAQRMREIGMLRTLGASRRAITRMLLLEAALLGLIGSIVGVFAGLGLSRMMVAMAGSVGFPIGSVKYPAAAFVAAPIVGLAATILGALRPALRAGRIPPIQAVLSEHRAKPLLLGRRVLAGTIMAALGLAGVFTLAASSSTPPPVIAAGVVGVVLLFSGVIMLGPVVVPWLVRAISWPMRRVTPIEGRLAADSSRGNPRRTASTASGLMIGIALVGAIGSLGSSFIGSIEEDLDRELKTDFTVQPAIFSGGGPQQTISGAAVERMGAAPGARLATGVRLAFLSSGYGRNYAAYGLDPDSHARVSTPEYVDGNQAAIDAALADGEIVLPEALAKAKDTKVGDRVELTGPRETRRLKVAAIQKGTSFESSSIVMANETFFAIYGLDGYSQILVLADSPEARPKLRETLESVVESDYPAFKVSSNEEIKKQIKDQINQVFAIFYVIMAVAIFVSLLGVVNTLLMNVLERIREIGVLRAVGSSRWQIRRIIVEESLFLTSAGAALGLVVGMALGYAFVRGLAASAGGVDFHPPVAVIFTVAALAVVFGLIAALLPARRAAKMNVIEAISYE